MDIPLDFLRGAIRRGESIQDRLQAESGQSPDRAMHFGLAKFKKNEHPFYMCNAEIVNPAAGVGTTPGPRLADLMMALAVVRRN
jgi:hypothetical protein